ncbi:response regulator [Siphonobacter curvatus]|uniref:DNA-binding response regulator n=1 Tax=Siphonobacter curvatus TaxID=2094562 RepID=A0A2S7IHP2_9BACT|nr:response regulator transcription factor [Siphonobacter curvatus]PQA55509.1 DNA-binding response regulator [Siphonobacter curvatus]
MKIAIIDDHLLVAESIKTALSLNSSAYEVLCFGSGKEFIDKSEGLNPDVIIVDIMMPDVNGLDFLGQFRETYATSKILALSALVNAHTVKSALRMGADGYVSKSDSLQEIHQAVEAVLQDKQYLSKSITNHLVNELFVDEQVVYYLTQREREVLSSVCMGRTIKETAYYLKLSAHTVQGYYNNIMKKFKVNRTADLIVFAIKHGLYNPL